MAKIKIDEAEFIGFVKTVKEFAGAIEPIIAGRNSVSIRGRYRSSVQGLSDTADRLLSKLEQ